MSGVRFEERRPTRSAISDRGSQATLEDARRRVHQLEADLAYERNKAKRTASAYAKVYERGGYVKRTDRDGYTQKTLVTGEPKKKKMDPCSLRGRFVSHVCRHI